MPIDKCVYLLEICNPLIAKKVLSLDTTFGINIPCKIGILENDNGYHIVYVDPESITEDKKNKLVLSNITTSLKNIISGVLS